MKRRSNGEGTIIKRPNGTWAAAISVGYTPEGKPKRKWVYGRTQREVKEKLAAAQSELQKGIVPSTDTLNTLITLWLQHKTSLKANTKASYEWLLQKYVLPELGNTPYQKLTPITLQHFFSEFTQKNLSARTQKYVYSILKAVFEQAVKWEVLSRNPLNAIDPPKIEKFKPEIWTPEEVQTFLEVARENTLYPLFYLAITTGLRRGELVGLRWQDIDSTGGLLTVSNAVAVSKGGALIEGTPKTASSRRTIAIGGDTLALLATIPRTSVYVFCSTTGGTLDPRNLQRTFDALIKQAGVRKIRLHDLRHTYASLAIRHGMESKVLSDRLGHTDIAFTMNTYAHLYEEQKRKAGLTLAELLTTDRTTTKQKKAPKAKPKE